MAFPVVGGQPVLIDFAGRRFANLQTTVHPAAMPGFSVLRAQQHAGQKLFVALATNS
ncbi:hypothetical protein [Rhodopseudomonas boonkerdii]|uniref:hypothetical protein n=1 Tax=Rhodopseudomonas boonkerdii TaxID=475937 RepID=UPI001E61FA44|nr:hypothetical protein [Rhodopseudomonas boonkerdii]